jgi:hypothetical protein
MQRYGNVSGWDGVQDTSVGFSITMETLAILGMYLDMGNKEIYA